MSSRVSKTMKIFEILLLLISIIAAPLIFLSLSIMVLFLTLNKGFFLGILLSFLFLCLTILWNSKYGVGGAGFIPPLKNYLNHVETEDDIKLARLSGILDFGILVILFLYFITFN